MAIVLQSLDASLHRITLLIIYFERLRASAGSPAGEKVRLQVVELHVVILQFLFELFQTYLGSTIGYNGAELFKLDNISKFGDICDRVCAGIEMQIRNWSATLGDQSQSPPPNLLKFERDLLVIKALGRSTEKTSRQDSSTWIPCTNGTQIQVLGWISSFPFRDFHEMTSQIRAPDTGNWLFSHPVYEQWLNEEQSMLLWLHGVRTCCL